MTERLYYQDALIRSFDGTVISCRQEASGYAVALNRTAFYAEAGGQPWDEGFLCDRNGNRARVINVQADKKGEIWHYTDIPLAAGTCVHGELDWDRRLDHMEQHAGEHLLASALWRAYGGVTQGLHTGREDATIDVAMPDGRTHLSVDELHRIEIAVNEKIRRNEPVRCWFPDAETLKTLPLRKPPTVSEHVRVVQMGDDEFCPCGGTHPPCTGMIGSLKILSAVPSRGKLRLRFVCGGRAVKAFHSLLVMTENAVRIMNAPADKLAEACLSAIEKEKTAGRVIDELSRRLIDIQGENALKEAVGLANGSALVRMLADVGDKKQIIAWVSRQCVIPGRIILCVQSTNGGLFITAAASDDVAIDLRRLVRPPEARGGGRDRFVTGQWMSPDSPEDCLNRITEKLLSLL